MLRIINEYTGVSITIVIALLTGSLFVANIYFTAQRTEAEVALIRQHLSEEARESRLDMIRIERRLSAMEAKIEALDLWCKEVLKKDIDTLRKGRH